MFVVKLLEDMVRDVDLDEINFILVEELSEFELFELVDDEVLILGYVI